jgi:hypothetical protein
LADGPIIPKVPPTPHARPCLPSPHRCAPPLITNIHALTLIDRVPTIVLRVVSCRWIGVVVCARGRQPSDVGTANRARLLGPLVHAHRARGAGPAAWNSGKHRCSSLLTLHTACPRRSVALSGGELCVRRHAFTRAVKTICLIRCLFADPLTTADRLLSSDGTTRVVVSASISSTRTSNTLGRVGRAGGSS